jgi:GntR family transcriptional regulator, histidine utilization repressor
MKTASLRKSAANDAAAGTTSRPASPAPSAQPALALYEQVKAFITHKIQDGSWPAGHRLPSESELVAQFGVARMTVNRALRELMDQGRITRVAGVGSFVAEDRPQSTLLQIANIASEIRARGHAYQCEFLVAERIAASPDLAVWLDLRPGESIFHTVCLHKENGLPVQLEDRYVNPRVVPKFLEQDFTRVAPGEYLLRNVPFDQIEHVVDAVLPNAEQAARLAMPATDPCLLLTRRTWTRGTPVTMVRCLHPASRYRLGSRFRADGNASAG